MRTYKTWLRSILWIRESYLAHIWLENKSFCRNTPLNPTDSRHDANCLRRATVALLNIPRGLRMYRLPTQLQLICRYHCRRCMTRTSLSPLHLNSIQNLTVLLLGVDSNVFWISITSQRMPRETQFWKSTLIVFSYRLYIGQDLLHLFLYNLRYHPGNSDFRAFQKVHFLQPTEVEK